MQSQLEWGQNKFIKFEVKKGGIKEERQVIIEAEFTK